MNRLSLEKKLTKYKKQPNWKKL